MTTIVKNLVPKDTFMNRYQRENVNHELTLAVFSMQTGRESVTLCCTPENLAHPPLTLLLLVTGPP